MFIKSFFKEIMRGCFVSVCRSLQKTLLEAEAKNRSAEDPSAPPSGPNENSKNPEAQNAENNMEQRQTDTTPQNCDAAYF